MSIHFSLKRKDETQKRKKTCFNQRQASQRKKLQQAAKKQQLEQEARALGITPFQLSVQKFQEISGIKNGTVTVPLPDFVTYRYRW